jgi:hypothetical protein
MTKTFACYAWLIVLLVFSSFAGSAQAPARIAVRLVAPAPIVCLGSNTVELEALLTNNGESAIEITRDGIRYGVELVKKDNKGKEDRRHIVREIDPDSWETLKPQQTIIVPFKEPITEPFFDRSGVYQIQIRYGVYGRKVDSSAQFSGAINSNSVMFEIKACGETRK